MRYQKKDDSFDLAIEKWNHIRQFVENAADNVMVEKIIKEKLGETTNNQGTEKSFRMKKYCPW